MRNYLGRVIRVAWLGLLPCPWSRLAEEMRDVVPSTLPD